jgi:biopolymer transport protein ExbB/TolQ
MLLWNLFLRGGFAMWPLLFCSIGALAILLDRAWYFWVTTRRSAAGERAIGEALAALAGGRRLEAMQLVRKERGMASNLMSAALAHVGEPRAVVERL